MKKIIVAAIAIILFMIIYYSVNIFIHYIPFLREKLAFTYVYTDESTIVENKNFGIRFELSGNCTLDGEVLNYLAARKSYFLGYFMCDGYSQRVSIQPRDENYPEDAEIISDEERVKVIDLHNGEYRLLKIYDSLGEKTFIFSSTKNENQGRGFEILEEINNSIEFF